MRDVQLLEGHHNLKNPWGARAVGEPPLLLALSSWLAIKNALSYVRPGGVPQLRLPATPERVLSCLIALNKMDPSDDPVMAGAPETPRKLDL